MGQSVRRFILILVCVTSLIAGTSTAVRAEEEKPTADLTVSALSAYIWRGQELSRDSIVIQPSMTVGYKGFSANVWSNLDTHPYVSNGHEPAKWNETDFTFSYGRKVGMVNLKGGYIYYGLEAVNDSQEVYLSAGLETLLSPTLTVYKEFAHYPSYYYQFGLSHAIKFSEAVSLNLSANVSYLQSENTEAYPEISSSGAVTGNKFSNFHDGTISGCLPVQVAKYVTLTPTVAYTFPLTNDAKNEMKFRSKTGNDYNFVYGGVAVSFTF